MPDVRRAFLPALRAPTDEHTHARSFLWADPTKGALQVFLPAPALTAVDKTADSEQGVWITADPLPGCVVCNIGESACARCQGRVARSP
jgi:isopenicillin N synthase-like dioxygenase